MNSSAQAIAPPSAPGSIPARTRTRPFRALADAILQALSRYAEHRIRMRQIRELRSLDARTLKDIGVDASSIPYRVLHAKEIERDREHHTSAALLHG